ncbi:MAG: TRAP transporter substrate-binding protein [Deltaproteobacteria bacterium]|nr:TRAP transporter substrate-binding protein [Deltaproteobacteria bacterium]
MNGKLVTASLVSLLVLASAPSRAEPVVAKCGSVAPEGTPWAEWLDGVRARIEKEANGALKLKVFLAGKLGGEKEMVEDTKKGALQMFGGSVGAIASTHVPELNVFELPYLFTSDAEADYVMNKIRGDVTKLLDARGFVMVMWAENGWHGYGVKGKCVEKLDDLKGKKMRSQESYIHLETYRAYGASPVEMPVPEVMTALQNNVVDGFSNTPLFSFATSWYSGIDSYTYTKHIYQPALIVLSKKWFEGLSPELKAILSKPTEEKQGFQLVRGLTDPLLENFTAAGKKVCKLTPDETKKFADASKKVWDTFGKKSASNKKILDAVLAAKAEFAKGAK